MSTSCSGELKNNKKEKKKKNNCFKIFKIGLFVSKNELLKTYKGVSFRDLYRDELKMLNEWLWIKAPIYMHAGCCMLAWLMCRKSGSILQSSTFFQSRGDLFSSYHRLSEIEHLSVTCKRMAAEYWLWGMVIGQLVIHQTVLMGC